MDSFSTNYDQDASVSATEDFVNWPKVIFTILICAVGLLGNSVVVFVIVVLREYKKSATHWYVLQLAFADSLFLLTLPFKISEDLNDRWIYDEWMCKAKETILFLNYYSSITLLMIMSADRYIAVCHTFSKAVQKLRKPLAAVTITSVTWVVCLGMCVPMMLYSTTVGTHPFCSCSYVFPSEKDERNHTQRCLEQGYSIDSCLKSRASTEGSSKYCKMTSQHVDDMYDNYTEFSGYTTAAWDDSLDGIVETTDSGVDFTTTQAVGHDGTIWADEECSYASSPYGWKVLVVFNFMVMYVLPIIVMVVCYSLIIMRLSSSSQFRKRSTADLRLAKGKNHNKTLKSEKNRRRVTIMCATLVATFVLLWLPFHVNHLAKLVGMKVPIGKKHICENLPVAGSLLAYLNSALNPYLYSFLGSNFKRRWNHATESMRKTTKRRIGNTSGSVGVRYRRKVRRRSTAGSSNNTATVVTKMYRGKFEKGGSMSETKPSLDSSHANSEVLCPINTIPTNGIDEAQE